MKNLDKALMGGIAGLTGLVVVTRIAEACIPKGAGEESDSSLQPVFSYVSAIRQATFETDPGESWSQNGLCAEIDVQNVGQVEGICTIQGEFLRLDLEGDGMWYPFTWSDFGLKTATIAPGQVATLSDAVLWLAGPPYNHPCSIRIIGDPGTTDGVPMLD